MLRLMEKLAKYIEKRVCTMLAICQATPEEKQIYTYTYTRPKMTYVFLSRAES